MKTRFCIPFFAASLFVLFASCDKWLYDEPADITQSSYIDAENPNRPEDNNIIKEEYTGGESNKQSIFNSLIAHNNNQIFFAGKYNSEYMVGLTDEKAGMVWKSICSFNPSILKTNADNLLVFGSENNHLHISLLDYSGSEISSGVIELSNPRVYDAQQLNDTCFYLSGSLDSAATNYPAIFYIQTDRLNTISLITYKIFNDYAGYEFLSFARDYDQISHDDKQDNSYYLSAHKINELDDPYFFSVLQLKSPDYDASKLHIAWITDIMENIGYRTGISYRKGSLIKKDEKLYAAGWTDAYEPNPPHGGGYWKDALLCGLSCRTGNIEFTESPKLSEYCDRYYQMIYQDQRILLCGVQSQYYEYISLNTFGNALISEFDLKTKEFSGHKTLGNNNYHSVFRSLFLKGGTLYFGGSTKYKKYEGSFQTWLVSANLELEHTNGSVKSTIPAPIGLGRKAGRL